MAKRTLLDSVNNPLDLRKLSPEQLPELAEQLRRFIIDIVSVKQGHLGASLGVVELTIALHYVFDTPNDLLVWDVGHQAYGHKIITGRKDIFHTNRQLNGISGFPKLGESDYDCFGVGHSSTSISAALGMAIASVLNKDFTRHHIAVIGDASIASGMAFEAINHAGVSDANLLIILNDNAIGIDPSVGALKEYLTRIKTDRDSTQVNIIENFNFEYSGPIDGHNLQEIIPVLQGLKNRRGLQFLHITTTKGKGLKKAEQNQVQYHSPGKFDRISGDIIVGERQIHPPKYQDVFGKTMVELSENNPDIVAITPAMITGSSLNYMLEAFPARTFDVGIAEQHAVTLSAGMATRGLIPFCNVYSTFLQRAYDQIIHDVALQKLPVVFCLDRAGLVGRDGATHHGVFDIAYLRCIPNMILFSPRDEIELRNILYTSQLGLKTPIAIRYPRGRGSIINWRQPFQKIEIGKGLCLKQGDKIAVLSIGTICRNVAQAIDSSDYKDQIAHYDMRFVKPLDRDLLHMVFNKFDSVITVEDGVVTGGFGSAVLEFCSKNDYKNTVKNLGVPDDFIAQASVEELQKQCGLYANSIREIIEREILKNN